jgi:hypothetical protein
MKEDVPTVVPALCMEYSRPDCLSKRWTCATSPETDAVGVPRGIRQKSAMHAGGVGRVVRSVDDAIFWCLCLWGQWMCDGGVVTTNVLEAGR